MKRFNRLRRAARKMAAEKGHELGVFQECPIEFSRPGVHRIIVQGKIYDGVYWMWARCIKCDDAIYISPTLAPHPDDNGHFHGTNPMNLLEIKAIKKTNLIQKRQEAAGLKGDFPKKSLGVIHGETILSQECCGYRANHLKNFKPSD